MLKATLVGLALFVSGFANAGLIEGFDENSWGGDWSLGANGSISSASAHDGSYGVYNPNSWIYNDSIALSEGDIITSWFKFDNSGSGRFYLGYGADITGAHSLVFGSNSSDTMWQDNPNYGYQGYDSLSFGWLSNSWYKAELNFGSNDSITGNLYGSDGSTLLRTMSTTRDYSGGAAIRGFGGVSIDTICLNDCSIVDVPEPSTLAIFALGIMGLASRRFKKQ